MSSTDGASEIYAKMLLLEKLGYPLWYPEPSEDASNRHREFGVRIGDVGNITGTGQFEFHFNVHEPGGCPPGFQVWQSGREYHNSNVRSRGTVIKRGAVTKVSLKCDTSAPEATPIGLGLGVNITCSSDDSAILVLPHGASSENLRRITTYLDNLTDDMVSQWLNYTESESVLLVTGCIKSPSWGVAAVSNTSNQCTVSLSFSATKARGELSGSYAWESTSDGHHRESPEPPSTVDNQCVFVTGYNISTRKSFFIAGKRKRKLVNITDGKASSTKSVKKSWGTSPGSHSSGGGASERSQRRQDDPADAERQDTEEDEIFYAEPLTDMSQRWHPSDVINKYLLEMCPNARYAITHDDEWCALVDETDRIFPDDDELLGRLQKKYQPRVISGCASLVLFANMLQDLPSGGTETDPLDQRQTTAETSNPAEFTRKIVPVDSHKIQSHTFSFNSTVVDYHGRKVFTKELRCVADRRYINEVTEHALGQMYRYQLVPTWSQLSHEHVVPLLTSGTNDDSLPTFGVPFYEEGNIIDFNKRCPGANKLNQIKQIAAGISYLHGRGISHGNICPANIMINDEGGICISDPLVDVLMRRLTYDTYKPIPAMWYYKSPEELMHATAMGPQADVYSWASLVYEVFSGRRPFDGYPAGKGLMAIDIRGHRGLERPVEISTTLWRILQMCWSLQPASRPTMAEVELHLRKL